MCMAEVPNVRVDSGHVVEKSCHHEFMMANGTTLWICKRWSESKKPPACGQAGGPVKSDSVGWSQQEGGPGRGISLTLRLRHSMADEALPTPRFTMDFNHDAAASVPLRGADKSVAVKWVWGSTVDIPGLREQQRCCSALCI
jgi:hypothetical protein